MIVLPVYLVLLQDSQEYNVPAQINIMMMVLQMIANLVSIGAQIVKQVLNVLVV